jgi:hypothetical protein
MKAYGEWMYRSIHIFLTSALAGGEWSASRPCRFTPRERTPGTHWIGDWVGPRAGLDDMEKRRFSTLPALELRPHWRPARIQSLCQLRCPGTPIPNTVASQIVAVISLIEMEVLPSHKRFLFKHHKQDAALQNYP